MEIIDVSDPTSEMFELLLDADPNPIAVREFLAVGTLHAMMDAKNTVVLAIVTDEGDSKCELKNLVTSPSYRRKGHASTMIQNLFRLYKSKGFREMIVGTADTGFDTTIPLYEKNGFKRTGIIEDFFMKYPEPVYENGRLCKDMILFSKML